MSKRVFRTDPPIDAIMHPITKSNEGPYRVVYCEQRAHFFITGPNGEEIGASYLEGHAIDKCVTANKAHHAALASVADDVWSLVNATNRILNTHDEASAKDALRLAISAPAIVALLSSNKEFTHTPTKH